MKIIGLERDNTACNHYRVLQPLYKLRQHKLADTLTIHEKDLATPEALDRVLEADIILFQRPASDEWFKFIKTCQKYGKIIVVDYDDDPFNTSPLNPYYKFVGVKEWQYQWPSGEIDNLWKDGVDGFDIERNIIRQDLFNMSFRKADAITTTTDLLAGFFKTLNSETIVLPNLVDFDIAKKYDMTKKEIRIGWQGGASHYEDIYVVRDAIVEVLRRNENVKFVYLGDCRFDKLFQGIPTGRMEFNTWVQFVAYPFQLPLLNLDIGLCPLIDNVFNRNKSAIKYFDYTTTGAATVASNIPPYSPVITNEVDGLLVENDTKSWVDAIERLVKDKEKRQSLADKAYENVYENWNADKKAYLWRDAYEGILKKDFVLA